MLSHFTVFTYLVQLRQEMRLALN